MRTALRFVVLAAAAIVVILAINTFRASNASVRPTPIPVIALDENAAAERLAGAVRFATISWADASRNDPAQLAGLRDYLEARFPKVHATLSREIVNGASLLYTWKGKNPDAAPILSLAHQDVVPIESGTEAQWEHPPFSGDIADGFVWGRGSLDDKASLMAQFEAVERLVGEGFQPQRTILFAFGHDEETRGGEGAANVAKLLASRGVKAALGLDEGGSITRGVVPGIDAPVASLMAAEKGYATFRLVSKGDGGHSARPPPVTVIGRLARAVARLEEHPFPTRLTPPIEAMLDRLAPQMGLPKRIVFANRWLFGPLIRWQMAANPNTNTLVRTTTAPTIIHAGIKDNVLPSEGTAVVNFRLLPGDTLESVERHIHQVIDDPLIEVQPEGAGNGNPSKVADASNPMFALVARTVGEVYPEAVVASGLVSGATDLRHYEAVYETRVNFAPLNLAATDLVRYHGTNERFAVTDYGRMIRFYVRLFENVPE